MLEMRLPNFAHRRETALAGATGGAERRSDPDITQQIRKVEGTLGPRDLGLDSCKKNGLEWLRTGRAL